jgi:hypothetical protein
MKTTTRIVSIFTTAACLTIGAAGCSRHEPPPLELLGSAKMAVHDAEQGDHTAQFAPAELRNAQQKVNSAALALDRGENLRARRLSEQAIVDAQLANAKTLTAQLNGGALAEHRALHELQGEIQRNE